MTPMVPTTAPSAMPERVNKREGCICIRNYFRTLVYDFECIWHGETVHIMRRHDRLMAELEQSRAARPDLDDKEG